MTIVGESCSHLYHHGGIAFYLGVINASKLKGGIKIGTERGSISESGKD